MNEEGAIYGKPDRGDFEKKADAGLSVGNVIRRQGNSSASYYKWKANYGGLNTSELKRIKELEGGCRSLSVSWPILPL